MTKKTYKGIQIRATNHTHVTRESDPDDRWSGEDTSTDWYIRSIQGSNKDVELPARFELQEGKTYYLVYGIYSTGDSFSRQDRGCIEYVDIYKSAKSAQKAVAQLQTHYDLAKGWKWGDSKEKKPAKFNEFSVDIVGGDGKNFTFSVPWTGYFECLDSLDVHAFVL